MLYQIDAKQSSDPKLNVVQIYEGQNNQSITTASGKTTYMHGTVKRKGISYAYTVDMSHTDYQAVTSLNEINSNGETHPVKDAEIRAKLFPLIGDDVEKFKREFLNEQLKLGRHQTEKLLNQPCDTPQNRAAALTAGKKRTTTKKTGTAETRLLESLQQWGELEETEPDNKQQKNGNSHGMFVNRTPRGKYNPNASAQHASPK